MLFKIHLFCFKPCTHSSSMARDISKPQPEEASGVDFENVGSICQSTDDKSGCKVEAGSSASRGRKSFSFLTGRVFFKRVLGYNDKDRSLESEGEPIHNVRKSVSNSQEMGYETSFKEPDINQEAKYVNNFDHSIPQGANVKTVELQNMAEEGIITERNPSEEAAVDNEVMGEAVSNEKEGAREDSMLYLLESPSFRVYCIHNVSVDGDGKDEDGDKDKENKSLKEINQKGSANQAVKRRRRSRFRTPLRNGGPARMKNLMFASCSCSNTTQESVCGSAGNAVR